MLVLAVLSNSSSSSGQGQGKKTLQEQQQLAQAPKAPQAAALTPPAHHRQHH
jgi:hypothetical protein